MYLTCTQEKDIATNTSKIKWTLTVTGGTSNYYETGPTTVKINGVTVYSKGRTAWESYQFPAARGSVSGELDVEHDTFGSKTISCSLATAIYWSAVETRSGTWALDDIPRMATITAAPNFTDEENPTIEYSNPVGTGVSSLEACICDPTGTKLWVPYRTIQTVGTSYTFQLTDQEREALQNATPDSNTMQVKFVIRTTLAGERYYDEAYKTITIVNADPTLDPHISDVDSETFPITVGDFLIRYFSDAYCRTGARAQKGATIASQSCTCDGVTIQGAEGTFYAVTSGSFIFTATDSRGNTVTQTVNVPFVEYLKPSCSIGNGKPDTDGRFTLTASGVFYSGDLSAVGPNDLHVLYRYKATGEEYSDWMDMSIATGENSYTATAEFTGLDYRTAYTFQCKAGDIVTSVYTDEVVIKALPVFDWSGEDFNFNVPVSAPDLILGGDPLVRIVEQGESNGWIYRKWSSGVMECWKTLVYKTAISNQWGNLYLSPTATERQSYPYPFTKKPIEQVTVQANQPAWVISASNGEGVNGTYASGRYHLCSPGNYASVEHYMSYYVIGYWK
jgi:hypothetical protein